MWNWLRVVLKENGLLFPFLAHLINTPEKETLALIEILSLFFNRLVRLIWYIRPLR